MKHGYAAFTKAEFEDARRRHPEHSLEGWAARHGAEYHGYANVAGFRPALPEFPEYVQNLVRGPLPGGRFGIAFHEKLQTHFEGDSQMPGSFHGRVLVCSGGGLKRAFKPDRTWIPFIGSWLNPPDLDGSTAFGTVGAWSPVTSVATPIPGAVGRLPRLRGVVRPRAYAIKGANGFDAGAFRMETRGWDLGERAATERAPIAAALAPVLERFRLLYADLELSDGVLRMRRNGYVYDAELDAFCADVAAVAAAVERLLGPPPAADFTAPLPPCPWTDADEETAHREPGLAGAWTADLRGYAAANGLVLEDPRAWHERFGALWMPGHAVAVMRAPDGRRVLFVIDAPIPTLRSLRGAIAFATPGRPDTPEGGVRVEGATIQVREGVTYAFAHRTYGFTSEAADMPAALLAASRT